MLKSLKARRRDKLIVVLPVEEFKNFLSKYMDFDEVVRNIFNLSGTPELFEK